MDLFPSPALSREAFASPRLSVVPVTGDNMRPTLRDNWDYVLVAPINHFAYDTLYVIEDEDTGLPLIFRVQSTGTGTLRMIRDNPAYGDTPSARGTEISREEFEQRVLGIVVCDLKVRDADMMRAAWEGGR